LIKHAAAVASDGLSIFSVSNLADSSSEIRHRGSLGAPSVQEKSVKTANKADK